MHVMQVFYNFGLISVNPCCKNIIYILNNFGFDYFFIIIILF